MTRVVTLDGCCREQPGGTISLQAGKYYLMRGIYKEGGGGKPDAEAAAAAFDFDALHCHIGSVKSSWWQPLRPMFAAS